MRLTLLTLAATALLACPAPPSAADGSADAGDSDAGFDAGVVADPYTVALFDFARITSKSGEPNFHKVTTRLEPLRDGPFENVTLIVDLFSTCYPFTGWASNPPPAGQNWPADCDAFDRNFEWTLHDTDPDAGTPGLELLRAITPFGGPLHVEVDVTDVFNGLTGPRDVEVRIPTYSDAMGRVSGSNGGWNVSGTLDVKPGTPPRRVLAVLPLVETNARAMTKGQSVDFTLPAGTTKAKLEYRVTGHGGATPSAGSDCIGPAEEFCRRSHTLGADGVLLASFNPWRTDCNTLCTLTTHTWPSGQMFQYCLENPCGAISSVRAPRANWCPGSVTPPRVEEPAAWASPGAHSFSYDIDAIDGSGQWRVTAVVFAYGD